MKLLALLPLAILAADVVVASAVPALHHRIARRLNRKKRCISRAQNQVLTYADFYHPPATSPPITHTTTTTDQPPPTPSPPTSDQPHGPQSGVINVESTCGDIGVTTTPTKTSGPNGSIYWLTCGIKDGGWRPPKFTVHDVIAQNLTDVLSRPDNPYEACRDHLDAFYTAASRYDLPPILLAGIALQESSCKADIVGNNGEQGLMQITTGKCPGGYASPACMDPYTNIDIAAHYLRTTLDECGGQLPEAMGRYNGWFPGMTEADPQRAVDDGRCFAQQNLDYLHETFNGWMQGVNPRALEMGAFFNLAQCKY